MLQKNKKYQLCWYQLKNGMGIFFGTACTRFLHLKKTMNTSYNIISYQLRLCWDPVQSRFRSGSVVLLLCSVSTDSAWSGLVPACQSCSACCCLNLSHLKISWDWFYILLGSASRQAWLCVCCQCQPPHHWHQCPQCPLPQITATASSQRSCWLCSLWSAQTWHKTEQVNSMVTRVTVLTLVLTMVTSDNIMITVTWHQCGQL